ncbi:hypothetical protein ES703_104064 [subsurface metagenome]
MGYIFSRPPFLSIPARRPFKNTPLFGVWVDVNWGTHFLLFTLIEFLLVCYNVIIKKDNFKVYK